MKEVQPSPRPSPEDLARLFLDPPVEFRPAPFWSWNDWLDADELCRQIDLMKKGGWGGFFMHSREGLRTAYLSEEWMALVRRCVDHAGSIGMKAWLYDEDKWPSGFAGGVLAAGSPESRHRFLLRAPASGSAPSEGVDCHPLAEHGEWRYCEAVGRTGIEWFNGSTYTDLTAPEVTRAYLESTHEQYRRVVGDQFGSICPGVFTDEPCWAHMGFGPQGALPWTRDLAGKFRAAKGYDLLGQLPLLFEAAGDYRRVRFDFFDVMTTLFRDGFTRQYAQWCEANGLVLTGHFMREDGLADQTAWIGAAMPHYRFMDWPGVDHLGRQTNQHLAQKQVASAASQLGKARVLCETFGASGQSLDLQDQKWIIDYHLFMGINFINPHLALYSMRGARKRDYPPNLFFQQPWWDAHRILADYTARLSWMLSRGRRVTRLLVLHPISTAWAEYDPAGAHPHLAEIDRAFIDLLGVLLDGQVEFELGDEMLLAEEGAVEGNRIRLGRQIYDAVLIPRSTVLRRTTCEMLGQLVESEGLVWRLGDENWLIEGREDERLSAIQRRIERLSDDPARMVATIRERLPADVVAFESDSSVPDPRFRCHLREDDGRAILFIANNHQRDEIDAEIRLRGEWCLEQWDPMTGAIAPVAAFQSGGWTSIRHRFAPIGSLLLVGRHGRDSLQPSPDMNVASDVVCVCEENWSVRRLDPNALLLDTCRLYSSSDSPPQELPVHRVAQVLREIPESQRPFRIEFEFHSSLQPGSQAFLVCETPERFRIRLNDELIEAGAFSAWWCDRSFRMAKIGGMLASGINRISLEEVPDDAAEPLEIECPIILGDFGVMRKDGGFLLTPESARAPGENLPREGWPFFSGRIVLSRQIDIQIKPGVRYFIEFDQLRATSLRIRINEREIDPVLWKPWRRDVTDLLRDGSNAIELELATSLFNLFGPHHSRQGEMMWVGPWMWSDPGDWTDEYFFVPYGVKGVRLVGETPARGSSG